ncbi:TetR/AcrR family transcriptional regulator [Bacillus canaveralius]|uniref:TetR/AcrR family transcriptional regulator n=1 Tax=Bacillus canaveralius TaxID=1403243 RepID=A0A2N5GG16_9BACI|nr:MULTISPECIES: TetR/AcrR family transcriptional regulator [Bacillus]PLR79671.1 TetR/AcrR family transcriptional regulator [Bacillus canaveralius]PLR80839.1 TetR/AcrR family transcriptional regulator [Bacillus sp. V33-4]PLS00863.1 TetR/AcrR family transcriptional regulator [Bacillus canaveralius]
MRKGERTKKMIIEKAANLFNQRGYVASTMVDVMNATGLERGGLYNHFSSKDELANEAFLYAAETIGSKYREALWTENHIVERLHGFLHIFSRLYEDTPIPGGCPIMNVAIETDAVNPVLKDYANQAMLQLHESIGRVVMQGIEYGEVSSQVNPEEVATVLLSSLEGALMLSRLHKDKKFLNQTIDHLQDYIRKRVVKETA